MSAKSALHELAMAFLPEEVIVQRLANEIINNGWRWRDGYFTDIRKHVRLSRPPWGRGKKRLEATINEMRRQRDIRRNRVSGVKPSWLIREQRLPSSRRSKILRANTNQTTPCLQLRHYRGLLVMLTGGYNRSLVVMQSDDQYADIPIKGSPESIAEAVLCSLIPRRAADALLVGASIEADFARLAIILKFPDGKTESFEWPHKVKQHKRIRSSFHRPMVGSES